MIGISHSHLVFRKYSKLGTTRNWIAVGSRLEGAAFTNGVIERYLHSFVLRYRRKRRKTLGGETRVRSADRLGTMEKVEALQDSINLRLLN